MNKYTPIPGYEGYAISRVGEIIRTKRHGNRLAGTTVKGWARDGYRYVKLKTERLAVHRLVCLTFNGPPPFDGAICRHLNDVKTDIRSSNLAWGTHQDNANDAVQNGSYVLCKGERHFRSVLTEIQVAEIKLYFSEFGTKGLRSLARRYGVAHGILCAIYRGKTWRDV